MPNEGKSSPSFQEVRPAMLPLHSFRQTLFPIRRASAGERVMSAALAPPSASQISAQSRRRGFPLLDEHRFSISVQLSALRIKAQPQLKIDFMRSEERGV